MEQTVKSKPKTGWLLTIAFIFITAENFVNTKDLYICNMLMECIATVQ